MHTIFTRHSDLISTGLASKGGVLAATVALGIFSGAGAAEPAAQSMSKNSPPQVMNPEIVNPAINNGTEPAADDWRYDAIGAFGKTNNLNGVNEEHNTFCCGTLITPDTVIMADHCLGSYNAGNPPPSGLYTMRFRRKPDGSLGTKAAGWASFHQVAIDSFTFPTGANDVVLAHLAEPVMHIDPICIGDASTLEADDNITFGGWGRIGPGFNEGDRGWLLIAKSKVTSVNSTHVNFPSAWTPSNPCACGPNNWDSGGAVLVQVPPRNEFELPGLELVGVIHTTGSASIPDLHQDVYADTCYCPGDIDENGVLDIFDINAFLALYSSMDPYGDWNGDGSFDYFDVNAFLDDFNAGCP